MGANISEHRTYSGHMSGNSGNISNNTGALSGNTGTISGVTIGGPRPGGPRPGGPRPSPNAPSTFTVANGTGCPVTLFYKQESLNTSDLIQGTSLIRSNSVGSIVIESGKHIECPVFSDLYVTAFQVTPNQPFNCPSGMPLFENLLAEYVPGKSKSCIITEYGQVTIAKKGQIWVDWSGVDRRPKKAGC